MLPVTATACAAASMKANPGLMAERMALYKQNRELALSTSRRWAARIGQPVGNFFMMWVQGDDRRADWHGIRREEDSAGRPNRWP